MKERRPKGPPNGARAPQDLLSLDQKQLEELTDEEIVSSYEELRDEPGPATGNGGRSYPNIRHLYATPLEREKDRRETRAAMRESASAEMQAWYEKARSESCVWWIQNHLVARHSLKGCISCGVCTSLCPAAQYYDEYCPRTIVDIARSNDEERIVELLCSDTLWLCGQCGSCKPSCPMENNIMGLVSSLRFLAQLKGFHLRSMRGRQQYAGRHLWGGNLWNRACSLYFRNVAPETHPDFGPRHAAFYRAADAEMARLGAHPDSSGFLGGRKVSPQTVDELRRCIAWGGTLVLWARLEEHAREDAKSVGLSIDEYHERVRSEG